MSTLNERIKTRRKELGLTQKELADMLSISDKTVSRWESGNQMPDAILIPELAQCLQISLNELYGIADNSPALSDENINSNESAPKEKLWLTLTYKISIIISLFVTIFGVILLIKSDPLFGDEANRKTAFIVFFIGCSILFLCEVIFLLVYKNKRIYCHKYLATDICYSGFSAIIMSVFLLTLSPLFYAFRFNYVYESVSVMIVVAFEIMMLWQKQQLKKHNVAINKKITVTSVVLGVVSIIVLLGLCIYFRLFFQADTETLPDILYSVALGTSMYRIELMTNVYAFFGVSLLLYTMLIMNYVELVLKSKKLE